MAAGKEIRGKIKSVENTKKITKAMEMVAASKMRKAQERMRKARPYADKVRNIAAHLGEANPEFTHPFMVTHDDAKRGRLSSSSRPTRACAAASTPTCCGRSRSRCASTRRRAWKRRRSRSATRASASWAVPASRSWRNVTHLGDAPHLEKLIGPVKVLLDAYADGKLKAVYLCYNKLHQRDRAAADGRAAAAVVGRADAADGRIREEGLRVGLPVRARRAERDRVPDGPLHRGAGVSRRRPRTWRPNSRRAWWR